MDDLLLNQFLLLGALLFCIGVYGVIARRNARARAHVDRADPQRREHQPGGLRGHATATSPGHVFTLFVITVAAAEVGVGLAIVLLIYRNRKSVDLDDVTR